MNEVLITDEFDANNLSPFLDAVDYKKFSHYPTITDYQVKRYLLEMVLSCSKLGKRFIAHVKGEIIAMSFLEDLEWDSLHFGRKCAKIDWLLVNQTADLSIKKEALNLMISSIEKYAIDKNIKFMSISIDSWDSVTSYALQDHNFKYILTWLDGIYSSKSKLTRYHPEHKIAPIDESELEIYKDIAARDYFKGGRFYADPNIDSKAVDKMYSQLITSSYNNKDILLSCKINNHSVGLFIYKKVTTYPHFTGLKVASLRFLLIDPAKRHKQLGYEIFAATLNYMMDRCDVISTGLEVHNLPSLNLHKKMNFKFNYTHNVFHWWSPDAC